MLDDRVGETFREKKISAGTSESAYFNNKRVQEM